MNSALVGTRFSTATASTAVATGMPDLRLMAGVSIGTPQSVGDIHYQGFPSYLKGEATGVTNLFLVRCRLEAETRAISLFGPLYYTKADWTF